MLYIYTYMEPQVIPKGDRGFKWGFQMSSSNFFGQMSDPGDVNGQLSSTASAGETFDGDGNGRSKNQGP